MEKVHMVASHQAGILRLRALPRCVLVDTLGSIMNLGCRESLGQELDDLLNLSSESEEDVDNQKLLAVLLSLWQQEPRRHVRLHSTVCLCCPKSHC
jgi:hypothetical protein